MQLRFEPINRQWNEGRRQQDYQSRATLYLASHPFLEREKANVNLAPANR